VFRKHAYKQLSEVKKKKKKGSYQILRRNTPLVSLRRKRVLTRSYEEEDIDLTRRRTYRSYDMSEEEEGILRRRRRYK
jgi:hypothetical protein